MKKHIPGVLLAIWMLSAVLVVNYVIELSWLYELLILLFLVVVGVLLNHYLRSKKAFQESPKD